ncbi:MAG: hypothetical protein ABSG03_03280 [Bryobacteraceae bacterium]|jgi:hypothetical protein
MLREEIQAFHEALARFNEWEKTHPPRDRATGEIVADLGTILDWIPIETRLADPDPQKLGVGNMIVVLRHLSRANE